MKCANTAFAWTYWIIFHDDRIKSVNNLMITDCPSSAYKSKSREKIKYHEAQGIKGGFVGICTGLPLHTCADPRGQRIARYYVLL